MNIGIRVFMGDTNGSNSLSSTENIFIGNGTGGGT